MKRILVLIALLIGAVSCNLMDFIPIGTLYGPDDYFFFTHRTRQISLYDSIVVSPEVGKPAEWDFTIDVYAKKSIRQEDAEGEDKEFFDAVCKKYGDVGYDKKELKVDGCGPDIRYVSPDIHSVSIYSDRDYDESHLAGAPLSDLFMVYANSSYPRFDADWRQDIKTGLLLSSVQPNDLKMLGFHFRSAESDLLKYPYSRSELDEAQKWICLMKLKVVKKPTLNKVHNLTFEFKDEYGKTYTSTLSYDFSSSSN
ncbi:MAG: hypothetical protein J5640_08510 [Bacteroidales bacterium]|nr:hypothetical protein [Bacteroidales bacterium]